MKILLQIVVLFWSTLTLAQDKTYVLTKKTENADINYELFKTFNDFEIYKDGGLKRAFEPVDGEFTTYTFISEYKGLSFDGTEKLFHDYLILKVDPKTNEISDGYQYTMEWAEPPASSDLYRISKTKIPLENNMNLSLLELERTDLSERSDWRVTVEANSGKLKIK
jgi:hypothetical protein